METAQTFLAFTRKVQNPVWEKIALRVIGGLHYRFGRKEESIQAFQQALAIQVPYKDAEILAGLDRTYRDLNQPNVAIIYYKQSVNKIEEIRQNIKGLSPEF
jgi:tetratricopeptide (TPR) repeat protein